MNYWWAFAIGLVLWPFLKLLFNAINIVVIEYRRKRFLKLVQVRFPNNSDITLISVDASDRRAMAKLERQLREQYDLTEEEVKELVSEGTENSRGDRGRAGGARKDAPRRRQDPPR